MTSPARAERAALCDLFVVVGPDAPTLAGAWTARDLAAHLVVRERRPDVAPGILTRFLRAHAERVRLEESARPWAQIVERLRTGPPRWSPLRFDAVDRLVNSVEMFVHHEDVRRARPGWEVRQLDDALEAALATWIRRAAPFLARSSPVGVTVTTHEPGADAVTVRKGHPMVAIDGPVGECVLFLNGRKDVARVALGGADEAVDAVRAAPFGI